MMANAAIDPFWRAKVSQEILINPAHSVALQTKCTSCHSPQGHYTAILRGATQYTIDEMIAEEKRHLVSVMKYMVTGAKMRGLGDKF